MVHGYQFTCWTLTGQQFIQNIPADVGNPLDRYFLLISDNQKPYNSTGFIPRNKRKNDKFQSYILLLRLSEK